MCKSGKNRAWLHFCLTCICLIHQRRIPCVKKGFSAQLVLFPPPLASFSSFLTCANKIDRFLIKLLSQLVALILNVYRLLRSTIGGIMSAFTSGGEDNYPSHLRARGGSSSDVAGSSAQTSLMRSDSTGRLSSR